MLCYLCPPHRESLSDPGRGCRGGCASHALVTEHVGRELGLGLGQTGPGGAVVAVDLQ